MKSLKKMGRALGKHVISLYSTGIAQVFKIRDEKKLQPDIESDPIVKEEMGNLGCLLVGTFDNFLALVLVTAHTVKNKDVSHDQGFDVKGYEGD